MIISTPNKLVFNADAGQPGPWHAREFDFSEFRGFLGGRFKDVIYLGQKVTMGSAVWLLDPAQRARTAINEIFVEKMEQGLKVVDARKQAPMFFVAIASGRDLSGLRQALESSILVDVSLSLLKEKNSWIEKFRRDVETLNAMVQGKDIALANINLLVQAREPGLAGLREMDPAMQAANSASEKEVADLKSQLQALHTYAQRKEQDLYIATESIANLHRSSAWRLVLRVRAFRDRFAPAGSLRRQFMEGVLGFYRPASSRPALPSGDLALAPASPDGAASRRANEHYAVCTIASKNYLGMVRVFAESVQRTNPGTPVYVLLVDRIENQFDPASEPYHLITLDELDNIPNAPHFFFKYDPIELNTAAKPYFLEYLFRKFGVERVCYFDPDILVFSGLDNLWKLMNNHSIVVTPHITAPFQDARHPNEMEINLAGVFNLGFLGIANTPTSAAFLGWWQARLYDYGYMNPALGMHVDQNWVNFAPVMHNDVFILRDPADNIAYWNLHERGRRLRFENDTLFIDHRPAVFYHFSGFDPAHVESISRYQDRFALADFPNLRPLFSYYRDLLRRSDYAVIRKWPYAFGRFDNGARIPQLARVLYGRLSHEQARSFGDPFTTSGPHTFFDWLNQPEDRIQAGAQSALTHLQMEIYRARADLQKAFPNPTGADRERFTAWLIANATREHNLDQVFLPPALESTRAAQTKQRIGTRQRGRNLLFSLHGMLKKVAVRFLPRNGILFQRLRTLDAAYFGQSAREARQVVMPKGEGPYPFGVNIAGYLKGEFGVAEAARASIKSMEAAGIPLALNMADTQLHRHEDDLVGGFSETNPYRINLVHANANTSHIFAREKGAGYLQGHYNIGYWFWELSRFPSTWRSAFDYYQEIWVASAFCQESISQISPVPVVKMTFPVLMGSALPRPDRAAFGLPDDRFLFGFVFDYLSQAERKNPMGLIAAFRQAFEDRRDALLVIKTINAEHAPEKAALLKELAGDSNVRFMDGHISRQEMTGLVASFDSFVSLHRSEGFGIGMAQAMYLGKPVIATGYSGNMDFMNHHNSYLVRYRLAELEQDYGPYEKGNVWADPDLEHAAELMRLVFGDRERLMAGEHREPDHPEEESISSLHPQRGLESQSTLERSHRPCDMQEPQDWAPQQQSRQDVERGQAGDHRVRGRKRAQARKKRALTAKHYGSCANPVEKITVVVTHFLIEMAARKHQTKEETDQQTVRVESVG